MFNINSIDPQLLDQINVRSLFDFYRLVDIDSYAVCDWHNGKKVELHERCFDVWKRDTSCKNCISRTCILENRQIIKLEYLEGQIFLVIALPVTLEGEAFSLELISNATKSLVINDEFHLQNISAQEIIGKMNDIAIHDSYTGIYNKRYAEQELCKEVLQWTANSRIFIGVLDIDHFKQINDTYGHVAGDDVLFTLAGLLVRYAEQADGWASRIGGDEFMILWRNISPQAAGAMALDLQNTVGAHSFTKGDKEFTISISIGLSEYRPKFKGWKEFLDDADQKMYRNKREKLDR